MMMAKDEKLFNSFLGLLRSSTFVPSDEQYARLGAELTAYRIRKAETSRRQIYPGDKVKWFNTNTRTLFFGRFIRASSKEYARVTETQSGRECRVPFTILEPA